MKKFLLAVMLLMILSGVGCAGAEPQNLSGSVNQFCWKYFATLERKENIFYSPYGIHAALSILANGASGDTRREILNALEVDSLDELNAAHKKFSAAAEKNYRGENIFGEFNLLLVNEKIFTRGLDKNFQSVVADVYKSDVRKSNFSDGDLKKISRWVSDKTDGFIPDYKSIATSATLTDLLNVVYFKGAWKIPFKSANTSEDSFTNLDGTRAPAAMMNNVFKNKIAYRADKKFKGIELPYTSNAALYLILPTDDVALNVADAWDAETFEYRENFLDALKNSSAFEGKVIVRLPKFESDIENNLVENFKAMGMTNSFTDAAEFFNIVKDTPLKIDNVQHRAKVKVDEQGTEAAAVTEAVMVAGAAPNFEPPQRVYFIANRPFVFVIRDVESGVILFAGAVNRL